MQEMGSIEIAMGSIESTVFPKKDMDIDEIING